MPMRFVGTLFFIGCAFITCFGSALPANAADLFCPHTQISGELKASAEKCDYLPGVYENHLIENLMP